MGDYYISFPNNHKKNYLDTISFLYDLSVTLSNNKTKLSSLSKERNDFLIIDNELTAACFIFNTLYKSNSSRSQLLTSIKNAKQRPQKILAFIKKTVSNQIQAILVLQHSHILYSSFSKVVDKLQILISNIILTLDEHAPRGDKTLGK